MKKSIKFLLLITLLILPLKANAATGMLDIYTSNKNPTVGSTFTITVYCKSNDIAISTCEYTLTFDKTKVTLVSASDTTSCNGGLCLYSPHNKNSSKTFTFKASATGSTTISATNIGLLDIDETSISSTVSPTTINIRSASSTSPSGSSGTTVTYSTNNYLKTLTVDNYEITPSFEKNTDTYSLELDSSIQKINIQATVEDSKAKVTGIGEKDITEGLNKFEIVVTSEKGTTKTYTLNVNVADVNPINITIDNKPYTVLKRLSSLTKPNLCEEETITINNAEVPSYTCEITGYTLIGLKDQEGNSNLYIYNNDTYTLYNELTFDNLIIGVLETDKVLTGYNKTTITINDNIVTGFKTNSNSNYTLLYGINVTTGKTNWYLHEETENTIQKFDEEEFNKNIEEMNKIKLLVYIFGGMIIFLSILLIVVATSKTKKKKKKVKEPKIDEVKNKDKEKLTTNEEKPLEKDKKKKRKDLFDQW